MAKAFHGVIHVKSFAGNHLTYFKVAALALLAIFSGAGFLSPQSVSATSCPDLKVIFARGSGGERYTSGHYQAFKDSMLAKLRTSPLTYEIDDLDYPAVSIDVGDGHLGTLLGAYIGSGDAYDFGDSVHQGAKELARVVNSDTCKSTKYVFAGYSQGSIVLLNGLPQIDPNRVIYVATFGDPKLYLPEGAGFVPPACSGKNLSEYRAYVPDCRAHKGILGARDPYVPSGYQVKIGTWCNKKDALCSSHFNIRDHTHYDEDGLYEDASRLIFSKIAANFNFKNQYTSPHDTAILIDSTGSMSGLIGDYKSEALNLAEKTFNAGGRVALYDYRDLIEDYQPVQYCDFETCTDLDTFRAKLNEITVDGGDDDPESLLSASLHVMKTLKWRFGSTKSLVVLTDAGYHSPDRDGTTFYDVKKLSQEIDPVNFYIITEESHIEEYQSLAEATGGTVASSADDLGLLTDTIINRYDSLPRVEQEFEPADIILPHLEITSVEKLSDTEFKISFKSTGDQTVVSLNDAILGLTDQTTITLGELRQGTQNTLVLAPISNNLRGDPVSVDLSSGYGQEADSLITMVIPKAPNTGRR